MKKRNLRVSIIAIFTVIFALVVSGCGQSVMEQPDQEPTTGADVEGEASLETSLNLTHEDGKVYFELQLKNTGESDVQLQFSSGQMFEIIATDPQGNKVYHYSMNKLFAQAITTIDIKAGETHTWKEELDYEAQGAVLEGNIIVEATILAALETHGLTLDENDLKASTTFEFQPQEDTTLEDTTPEDPLPEEVLENKAFRNIKVEGENGVYTVTGEARVFEAMFGYSVTDGHVYYVEDHAMTSEGAPGWGTFTLNIDISDQKLPINGKVMLELYENSAKDGSRINELFVTLEWIK